MLLSIKMDLLDELIHCIFHNFQHWPALYYSFMTKLYMIAAICWGLVMKRMNSPHMTE